MSENYFQHADHFVRILSEQEKNRANKVENILFVLTLTIFLVFTVQLYFSESS